MNEPKSLQWAGVCAGGYFGAAAVYLGNVVVLTAFRPGDLLLAMAIGALPVICVIMGWLVLSGKRWAPRLAVVVAGEFAAIHLIGLARLFLVSTAPISALAQSLQWQLGSAFLLLWLSVLWSAFRLAKGVASSAI
jgi:hypothetical protein